MFKKLPGDEARNLVSTMRPGGCRSKAHKPEHLGYAGRRVLVSRKWSGKTLREHKQDRRAWVMEALGLTNEQPVDRYAWRPVLAGDPDLLSRARHLLNQIVERQRWRMAMQQVEARATGQRLPAALPAAWRDAHASRDLHQPRRCRTGAVEDGYGGRADCSHDRCFRALVLLATFASLRWGEVSALRRTDVDLDAGTVRTRAAYVERSAGGLVLSPPKSKAGQRVVGIPKSIVSALCEHIATYVQDEPGALLFPGAKGGPLRRSGFNMRTRWVNVVGEMGLPGLHFHDLRHTGNMLAAESGAGLKDLMARMGHDNVRAAMIYQHAVRGADRAIMDAIDRKLEEHEDHEDGGSTGAVVPAG
ncbi:replication initiator [Streptosporangium sp. NPDC087985]|uniref:site-specific integrase n=1 Tax=Streptosporangium sp. NPDC087985 TaxID=3366196 RepID=UPI003807C2BF